MWRELVDREPGACERSLTCTGACTKTAFYTAEANLKLKMTNVPRHRINLWLQHITKWEHSPTKHKHPSCRQAERLRRYVQSNEAQNIEVITAPTLSGVSHALLHFSIAYYI